MQMLLSAAPLRFFVMMQNIYQVKYCSVIIRFVHSSRTIAAGGVRGWGDRLDAATAAEAETAHSLLRIAKGGAPASSNFETQPPPLAWATRPLVLNAWDAMKP